MDAFIIIGQIVLLNIVLSADNAIVIAMASRNLPPHQRKVAVWLGTIVALLFRVGFMFIAVHLMKWPLLQIVGAVLLVWIAIQLLKEREEKIQITKSGRWASAVWLIVSADLIMSVDNVIAIAAVAEQQLSYLLFGVMMSIPLMIWGSQLFIKWIERYPLLNKVGALILLYTAGEMLVVAFT
jgi:YjbE family integral membrane protein